MYTFCGRGRKSALSQSHALDLRPSIQARASSPETIDPAGAEMILHNGDQSLWWSRGGWSPADDQLAGLYESDCFRGAARRPKPSVLKRGSAVKGGDERRCVPIAGEGMRTVVVRRYGAACGLSCLRLSFGCERDRFRLHFM